MTNVNSVSNKWYILILSMLTLAMVAGVSRMCMPVLFKQISIDLDLSLVAIGTIWGMDPLAGFIVALPGGMLVDRFGIKSTLAVICIFAGLFGALRGLSVNFASMAAGMFLFGLLAAAVPSVLPKAVGLWFSGRQLGWANAITNITWALGGMAATMFSATVLAVWLGGWRRVLYVLGTPCVILGFFWLLTVKEGRAGSTAIAEASRRIPLKEALMHVTRLKAVWLLGISGFFNYGASSAFIGYLPLYLRDIGWTPAIADSAMTAASGVGTIGILPMVFLANRIRSPKAVLLISTVIMAVTYFLLPLVEQQWVWLMLIINGMMRGSSFTLMTLIIFQTKGIGGQYSGTAMGLANAIGMLGSCLAPPIGNSLSAYGAGIPIFFWALMTAAALPFLFWARPGLDRHGL